MGQHGKRPYEITDHLTAEEFQDLGIDTYYDCPEEIWDDFENGILLPEQEIMGRGCPACVHLHEVWYRIIEQTGDHKYGIYAFSVIRLKVLRERYPSKYAVLTAWERTMLDAIEYEQQRIVADLEIQQQERMSRPPGKQERPFGYEDPFDG